VNHTPIGIDVGDLAVRAVQFTSDKRGLQLHAAVTRRIRPGEPSDEGIREATIAALRAVARSGSFIGTKVVTAMPRANVDIRAFRLSSKVKPEDGPAFLDAVLDEIRSTLLYPPEQACLDFIPISTTQDAQNNEDTYLLVASRQEKVKDYLSLFDAVGFHCLHLDVASCAVARVLGDKEEMEAFIELNHNNTVISMSQGGELRFSRTVKLGLNNMIDELCQSLNFRREEAETLLRHFGMTHRGTMTLDLAMIEQTGRLEENVFPTVVFEVCSRIFEMIVTELQRSVNYVVNQRHGGAAKKSILHGIVPANLDLYLSERLSMPVVLGDALAQFSDNGETPNVRNLPYAVAVGLALRDEVP